MFHASDMVQEGYIKYKGKAFKIPNVYKWRVIVSGPELIEELHKAPDNELSFLEAANDSLKVEFTLGPEIHHNPYHIPIIRSQLTRNLGDIFSDIHDEMVTSFDDIIQVKDDEWVSVPVSDSIMQVVCRSSNRLFVGLPLCRDPDWIALNIQFAMDVFKGAITIDMFPQFMASVVAQFLTNLPRSIRRGIRHLQPVIEERKTYLKEYGDHWAEKPNDMLAWLMDEAEAEESTIRNLTMRILAVNSAAIHTSSKAFTHALLYLAASPQFVQPLREEVEAVLNKDGWSKSALTKMHKVDSFLKEIQRLEGFSYMVMGRKALRDYTFSDGTFIPAGTKGGEELRHRMVSTNLGYLPFGHGRHACPGRFFAENELKTMLAHIVVTYDVKLEKEGVRPANSTFFGTNMPNPKAQVMFRTAYRT
ncbi:hypothetical protein SERLADRAFT_444508 [Serpula lacrymans var. lacrymans S7.9]|uniref:Cytochrome P450 n=1 Tax=Serpula lacrymans var. lacrymans (strain S7.9) TaxID=578457 RepID=F8NFW5_SERL9|nr:uncharacterized protein SERLADRAFT_444508 [Serpula lacrymans var. lacrymans S7.9]EGO30935.1 hypothetical protein SERLADRAFT_444508 [Serpula lacrymans var. lacrymans S7.9]